MYQFIQQKYMRAVLPVIQKNKTEYSIDDIIGEAIRDPCTQRSGR